MLARNYNTKIQIYTESAVPDGFGGNTNAETLIKSVWAKVKSSNGTKFQDFGISEFINPVIFSIRGKNNIDITVNNFVRYQGKRFAIKGIQNKNYEGIEIDLLCDEG